MLLKPTMVIRLVAFLVLFALPQPASAFQMKRVGTDSGTFLRLRGGVRDEDYSMMNLRAAETPATADEQSGQQRGTQNQAIGKSKGGMTTKILALVDALGNLVHFVLLPGQRFDTIGVEPLIEGINFGVLLGDKAFDSNSIIAALNKRGAKIVISQHPRRAQPLKIDQEMYKWRHLDREFLLQTEGIQTHRDALRQNRSELRRNDLSRRSGHQFQMNLNRP